MSWQAAMAAIGEGRNGVSWRIEENKHQQWRGIIGMAAAKLGGSVSA